MGCAMLIFYFLFFHTPFSQNLCLSLNTSYEIQILCIRTTKKFLQYRTTFTTHDVCNFDWSIILCSMYLPRIMVYCKVCQVGICYHILIVMLFFIFRYIIMMHYNMDLYIFDNLSAFAVICLYMHKKRILFKH